MQFFGCFVAFCGDGAMMVVSPLFFVLRLKYSEIVWII